MKKFLFAVLGLTVLLAARVLGGSPDQEGTGQITQKIDAMIEQGAKENHNRSGMDLYRKALDTCVSAMQESPGDYEVLWRCSMAAHHYGETARNLQIDGWKEICREWGKRGMDLAEKGQQIEPKRAEAFFWEAACVGIYSDAAGPVTAIKEGFYKKSKAAMAAAYELDKSYNDYDPVFGSAMFYISVPFPFKDKKKALEYYREFEKSAAWTVKPYTRSVHAANLLMEVRDSNYKEEARRLLERALADPHPVKYYQDWAQELMQRLR